MQTTPSIYTIANMSSSTAISTIKFKKKKKKKLMTKSRSDDEDEDDSNQESSLLNETKKRRKLIHSSQYQKGIDSQQLLMKKEKKKTVGVLPQQQPDKKDKLFKTTFSSSNSNGPIETVIQQKHQIAMEEFISKRMNHNDQTTATTTEENDDDVRHNGTTTTTQDADQGAGGTMLGGTGIAEVILPVEQRLETVKRTQELLQMKEHQPRPHHRTTAIETTTPHSILVEEDTPVVAVDSDRLGFQAMRHGGFSRENNTGEDRNRHSQASDSRVFKKFLKREGGKTRR